MVVLGDDKCVMLRNCPVVLVENGAWQVQLWSLGDGVGLLVMGDRLGCGSRIGMVLEPIG